MLSSTTCTETTGKSRPHAKTRNAGKTSLQTLFFFLLVTRICFAHWEWQNPLPQENTLKSVKFIDSNIDWAVGQYTLIRTTDSGFTLETYSSVINSWSRSISLVRSNKYVHSWICGLSGNILHTVQCDLPIVGVKSSPTAPALPVAFELQQNYPNPFNTATAIEYSLPKNSYIILKIFDILGHEVQSIVSDNQAAGSYRIQFDGTSLATGLYFYSLHLDEFKEIKKMLVIK